MSVALCMHRPIDPAHLQRSELYQLGLALPWYSFAGLYALPRLPLRWPVERLERAVVAAVGVVGLGC